MGVTAQGPGAQIKSLKSKNPPSQEWPNPDLSKSIRDMPQNSRKAVEWIPNPATVSGPAKGLAGNQGGENVAV